MEMTEHDAQLGNGYLDISVFLMYEMNVISLIPRRYKVIGSCASAHPDTVRLLIQSDQIKGYGRQLVMTVSDDGNIRQSKIELAV